MHVGSAIYAFFIVAGTIPNASTLTDLNFELDGSQVGTFLHNPTGPDDYQYNVTGYANTSIPNGPHQLDIIASGKSTSIVLFDYAVYTYVQENSCASLDEADTFIALMIRQLRQSHQTHQIRRVCRVRRLPCNREILETSLPLSVLSSEDYCCS